MGNPFKASNLSKIILTGTINGSVAVKRKSSIALSSEIGIQDSIALASMKNNVKDKKTSIMLENKYNAVNLISNIRMNQIPKRLNYSSISSSVSVAAS